MVNGIFLMFQSTSLCEDSNEPTSLHKNRGNSWSVGRLLVSEEGRRNVELLLIKRKKVSKLQLHFCTSWWHVWEKWCNSRVLKLHIGWWVLRWMESPRPAEKGDKCVPDLPGKFAEVKKSCPCRQSDYIFSNIQSETYSFYRLHCPSFSNNNNNNNNNRPILQNILTHLVFVWPWITDTIL